MTSAWMLRQDGSAFPVIVHLYCMNDPDLSSEAECASFIIKTKSKDKDLAEYVIDCWLAFLIENIVPFEADSDEIDECIKTALNSLNYYFQYSLSVSEYIDIHNRQNNYNSMDSLYDFIDGVRETIDSIQNDMKNSLNQQFCRVRYGGENDTESSNNTLWFRISSVRFNWADVIYSFAIRMKNVLNVSKITICRDFESDNNGNTGSSEYFYKAKDGSVYRDMPIDEFLQEDHEHAYVFSSRNIGSGVYTVFQKLLSSGHTIREINCNKNLEGMYINDRILSWFRRKDQSDCVLASEYMENATTRTRAKLGRVIRRIKMRYPEITDVDVDAESRENAKGNPVGITYILVLKSNNSVIDGIEVRLGYTKPYVPEDILFRDFRLQYDMWKKSKNLN